MIFSYFDTKLSLTRLDRVGKFEELAAAKGTRGLRLFVYTHKKESEFLRVFRRRESEI